MSYNMLNLFIIVKFNLEDTLNPKLRDIRDFIGNVNKTMYTNKGKLNKVNQAIFDKFNDQIDFRTLEFKPGEVISVMNFKIILLLTEAGTEAFWKHSSIRHVIQSFSSLPTFEFARNLNEYDVVTFMKQKCVLILINGTSGAGKSTVASLLAKKYEIRNVFSTDFIRSMMRNFVSKEENPLLHASTFETGNHLTKEDYEGIYKWVTSSKKAKSRSHEENMMYAQEMSCVKGYEDQCTLLEDNLMKFIDKQYQMNRSFIVEGVHVSEALVNRCMKKYHYCIPLFIYVDSEDDHLMRFSSRCKGASVDPKENRYAKHFNNIRAIQKAIMKNSLSNKFIKIENLNAKKTTHLFSICIRKYVKELNEISFLEHQKLAINRKWNILDDVFEKAKVKVKNQKQVKAAPKKSDRDEIWKELNRDGNYQTVFCRKDAVQRPWFLKHEKIFHTRTKKFPLVSPQQRRIRSARKRNRYQTFNWLEVDKTSLGAKRNLMSRIQHSISEMMRKEPHQANKSKASESTACTITKIKASK